MSRIFKCRASAAGIIMSNSKQKGELSQTCKTYLEKWYANDEEDFWSKETEKGNFVELETIDFAARVLGYGMAEKNTLRIEDEFLTGECDTIFPDAILDAKSPWNRTTFYKQAVAKLDVDYEWQLNVYCHLFKRPKGILFYGLMDTPEDVNYGKEVIFSDMKEDKRWFAYHVKYDSEKIELLNQQVIKCREYLAQYEKELNSKLGKIN